MTVPGLAPEWRRLPSPAVFYIYTHIRLVNSETTWQEKISLGYEDDYKYSIKCKVPEEINMLYVSWIVD